MQRGSVSPDFYHARASIDGRTTTSATPDTVGVTENFRATMEWSQSPCLRVRVADLETGWLDFGAQRSEEAILHGQREHFALCSQ